jgi:23S rRNA pseudouridine1911/1915/1917 synthase
MALEIIYEDNHLIAVNKKAGDLSQGDKTGDDTLADDVKAYIKKKYNKPGDVFLGIVHRLDRPVSGVTVFARTSKALERLNKMFQEKTIQKKYWAIVEGQPPAESGTLVHYIKKDQEKNKSRGYDKEVRDSKRCELDYQLLGRSKNYFYLEIIPKTGRHHQIRVQLSTIGCIIKGDVKYGGKRTNKDGGIHLFSRQIAFEHPTTKVPLVIKARPIKDPLWNELLEISEKANIDL